MALCYCCRRLQWPTTEDNSDKQETPSRILSSLINPICQEVYKLQLACNKLGELLSATVSPRVPSESTCMLAGAARLFCRNLEAAPAGTTDVGACHLQWLRPVAQWKRWTLTDSSAYVANYLHSATQTQKSFAGLLIVVVHDGLDLTKEAIDAGYRDQLRRESGDIYVTPRVLPINCRTIMTLDLNQDLQQCPPRIVPATTVNQVLGVPLHEPSCAALAKQIKADDPALLWMMMDVRIGSMIHIPPCEFRLVVPSYDS